MQSMKIVRYAAFLKLGQKQTSKGMWTVCGRYVTGQNRLATDEVIGGISMSPGSLASSCMLMVLVIL